jgi:hypothetical protein
MSDALILGLTTTFASLLTLLITQGISWWVNKKKVPVEVKKLELDTSLSKGELAEKFQQIASAAADENIELATELKTEKTEKRALMRAIEEIRKEMLIMEERHLDELKQSEEKQLIEIKSLRESFEKEKIENQKWKDWAHRLALQLGSWGLTPVPFDIEEAKKKNLYLGDMGNCKPQE